LRYSTDGQRVWFLDEERRLLRSASRASGADALSLPALYGVLPELSDSLPFWMELETAAGIEGLGATEIDGVACDLVRVVYPPTGGGGGAEFLWALGQSDHLPREQVGILDLPGQVSWFRFRLRNIRPDRPSPDSSFALTAPAAFEVLAEPASFVAVGNPAPDWSLRRPSGEIVSLRQLRGRVVVMDFWASWCPLCKSLMPGLERLRAKYDRDSVAIFGINVFDRADAVHFWKEKGLSYDLLLGGDRVAGAYQILFQPAVVVVDQEGRLVYRRLGSGHDRNDELEQALRSALQRIAGPP
jgi:thiol-disulfide isomerase/thioredoxin